MWYKRFLCVAMFSIFLMGCRDTVDGLKPLYKPNIVPEISDIYVETIDGEQGVFIRNLLQSRMRYANNPRYRVQVSFGIGEKDLAIARDNTVARKQVRADMNVILYKLADANTEFKQLYQFSVFGTANFSSSSGPFTSEVSEQDAIRRALTIASENAILRLASYFYER